MAIYGLIVMLAALMATGPFALLGPRVKVSEADRRDLDRGLTVAGIVPGGSGQVAVYAISAIDVAPEVLISSARSIEDLKRSSFVKAIHRFSDPPQLDDLATLSLPPREVQAAMACVVGDCALNLTAAEITLLERAAVPHLDCEDRVQRAFREIVLARVNAYLAGGPEAIAPDAESFLYWSQETYGAGKPVVVVTHVSLVLPRQPGDPAIVVGRHIMATHYITTGESLMAITTDPLSGRRYLIYLNRIGLDLLGGMLGPIKRAMLESRLKRDVPGVIQRLRLRLERRGRLYVVEEE